MLIFWRMWVVMGVSSYSVGVLCAPRGLLTAKDLAIKRHSMHWFHRHAVTGDKTTRPGLINGEAGLFTTI